MGSVSSPGSNISNLIQALGSQSPELSSLLSKSNVKAALEKASPADVVKLSDAAIQLQNVSVLFGDSSNTQPGNSLFSDLTGSSSSTTSSTQTDPLLQALESSVTTPGAAALASSSKSSSAATSTPTTAAQAATAASNAQTQALEALFGNSTSSNSSFNTLA